MVGMALIVTGLLLYLLSPFFASYCATMSNECIQASTEAQINCRELSTLRLNCADFYQYIAFYLVVIGILLVIIGIIKSKKITGPKKMKKEISSAVRKKIYLSIFIILAIVLVFAAGFIISKIFYQTSCISTFKICINDNFCDTDAGEGPFCDDCSGIVTYERAIKRLLPASWQVTTEFNSIPPGWLGADECEDVRAENPTEVYIDRNGHNYNAFHQFWFCPPDWDGEPDPVVGFAPLSPLVETPFHKIFYDSWGENSQASLPDQVIRLFAK